MKICLVIPVYNNHGLIEPLVEKLHQVTDLDLLIIDDGSEPKIDIANVNIHRFEKNKGKGVALQWALKNSSQYSHIITMDGDGQHLPEDIPKFVEAINTNPKDLIIGNRVFDDSVPGISQFGRKFSNFWVKYQTGHSVQDSQSGFRVYPLELLANLKFYTKRYDFEIEILVRAIWRGLKVREIPVSVIYPPEDQRVSHFHKLKDNTRITLLNIYLIAYSLIFYQKSFVKLLSVAAISVPFSMLSSFWLGAFLGIFSCVILRLNALLMLVCLLFLRMII